MALSRVKTWNAAETLTASDLNAEFNNICNHFGSLDNDDINSTATFTMGELIVGSGITSADGGQLHVHTASAGTIQAVADADEAVFENSAASGITILSGTSSTGMIAFGDSGDADIGKISYSHSSNGYTITANAATALQISSAGAVTTGGSVLSDTDSTDSLGSASVRWANLYVDSIGDTGQALAITAGTNAINLTAGDVTLYDDNNNADTSISMGTSATEALVVQALNGGSNKTLEELRLTTKTASGTADHGKVTVYVDEAHIADVDDSGINLASGKTFRINGTNVVASAGDFSGPGSATDNAVVRFDGTGGKTAQNSGVTIDDSNNATGFANLTLSGELDAATGDFSGDVDIDGTLETDALTIGGTTLLANDSNNRVTTATGSGTLNGEANLTFDGSTLLVGTSIAATADTNTSIGLPGSDVLTFSTGGTEALRINDEGVLGVKTTPASGWHTDHGVIQIGTGALWVDPHDEASANNMVFLSNNLYRDSADEWRAIVTDEATRYYQYGGEHYFDTAASTSAGAAVTFTNRLHIASDGNIGINCADPTGTGSVQAHDLVIGNTSLGTSANTGITLMAGTGGISRLDMGDTAASAQMGIYCNHSDDTMNFVNGASVRLSVASNGSVTNETSLSGGHIFNVKNTNASNPSGMQIYFAGTSSGDTTDYFYLAADSGATRAINWSNGDWVNANNSYGSTSDVKLKQDIVDAPGYWDDFKALRYRKFRLKSEVAQDANAGTKIGLIAQEIEGSFSKLVDESPDREMQIQPVLDDEGNATYEQTEKLDADGNAEIDADGNVVMVNKRDSEGNQIPKTTEAWVKSDTTTKSIKYSVLHGPVMATVVQELQTRLEAAEAKIAALEAA